MSLAEHLHLDVGLVDVDGDVVELPDELLDVLRLELGEVEDVIRPVLGAVSTP